MYKCFWDIWYKWFERHLTLQELQPTQTHFRHKRASSVQNVTRYSSQHLSIIDQSLINHLNYHWTNRHFTAFWPAICLIFGFEEILGLLNLWNNMFLPPLLTLCKTGVLNKQKPRNTCILQSKHRSLGYYRINSCKEVLVYNHWCSVVCQLSLVISYN